MSKKAKNAIKKFYNFNTNESATELYIYGEIMSGTWKWDESDVTFEDFRNALDGIEKDGTLNMYINSPGGSVFTTQGIISMLKRAKEQKNITINAYGDGLCASCASWLPCVADNFYIYKGTMGMLHKPMTMMWGNANEMRKEIELLDKIEEDMMIPLYMSKAKEGVTEDKIREMLSNETWLTSDEMLENFNVTLLEDEKQIAACVEGDIFKNFKNIPDDIKDLRNKVNPPKSEPAKNEKVIELEDKLKSLEKTNSDLESEKSKLANTINETSSKLITLNEEIKNLKAIKDEFDKVKAEEQRIERENKLNEKMNYYKEKFENLDAKDKFESEEVQNLIKECIDNQESLNKINLMLVDMIQVNQKSSNEGIELGKEYNNLKPGDYDSNILEKYGYE